MFYSFIFYIYFLTGSICILVFPHCFSQDSLFSFNGVKLFKSPIVKFKLSLNGFSSSVVSFSSPLLGSPSSGFVLGSGVPPSPTDSPSGACSAKGLPLSDPVAGDDPKLELPPEPLAPNVSSCGLTLKAFGFPFKVILFFQNVFIPFDLFFINIF